MYFKRLEIHGFKSFAEPVVIDFHAGITAIVGPNGSGKSNISDAIKWVLGEQSPKALRGGKMEEVIFNGTASRKSRGMAEVVLIIDNSTGILDIDYNEVAICRRMYRSGESEYLINNNQCRLKDIRELIMDTGIGVDGYSIIGQGKIADIISNKTESRREIFEEAAGVVMYKTKKAQAERKLESSQLNLDRANDIIGEIESRIDGLKEDSDNAKEYLALKERYEELEINIILRNLENLESNSSQYRNDMETLSANISQIEEKRNMLSARLNEAKIKDEELEILGNDSRDKLLSITKELNSISNSRQLNEASLSALAKDEVRIGNEMQDLDERILREESNLKELEKSEIEIKEKYIELKKSLHEKEEEFRNLEEELSEFERNENSWEDELFRLYDRIKSGEADIKYYENYLETLKRQREQITSENHNSNESKKNLSNLLEENMRNLDERKRALDAVKETLEEDSLEEKEVLSERQKLLYEIDEIKQKYSRTWARQKAIQEMENNYEGYNLAVKHVMKSDLTGIEGAVADLIKVPQGLETAIETALGAAMQNIITSDDKSAQKAVEELKRAKAGRLTFLPISSIRGNRVSDESKLIKEKGYKGLAVDLINFNSRYKSIFEYLLGRVAVADTMENAISMSKKADRGIRFVTLEGEIISQSGAITGGQYKNKTANLLSRKSEILSLQREGEDLKEQLSRCKEALEETEERIEDLKDILKGNRIEEQSIQLEIVSLKTKIASIEETLQSVTENSEKHDRQLSTIRQEEENAKASIENIKGQIKELSEEREVLKKEMEESSDKKAELEEKLSDAKDGITESRVVVSSWREKRANMDTLMLRVKDNLKDLRIREESKKEELAKLTQERERLLGAKVDNTNLDDELKSQEESLRLTIREVEEEKKRLKAEINKASEEHESLLGQLNSISDQKYRLEIKLTKGETQLETLKERLWEDFEISYAQALDRKIEDFPVSTATKESREIKSRINALGDVNVGAIKEYEQVKERYDFLTVERGDIIKAIDELKAIISDMEKNIRERFKENFEKIVANFEDIFKELFGGGYAELRLDNPDNPLESGIDIIAQPPGKKLQNINLLSGGEKTMTAIALMFAVLKTRPTPFCILDEVEAALDDRNIDRFGNYLKNFENIQFALVTHHRATMEHADVLYGVTMPERGVSKILSLRLGDNFKL